MKHVMISGASKGLGLGLVKALLQHGYKVSCCSRTPSDELMQLAAAQQQLKWFRADIADEQQCKDFVTSACAWANGTPLWGLINNAAIAQDGILATFPNVTTDSILQVNLHAAIYLAREALRVFLRQNSPGRIINISSIIGQRGYTGLAAYSASKAGLDGLTRALARENGRRGITVNSIAPGYMDTDMSADLAAEKRAQIIRRTPLGRLGSITDIAPTLLFLLSDNASFITGQTITIDGGITN